MKVFSIKKSVFSLALVALVAVAFSSCQKNEPVFYLQDLQGLWLEKGDTVVGHYVRFTEEKSDENPYLLGREWTTSDDKHEEDLINQRTKDGHPGNGWFQYDLKTDGTLTEIHLMKNGGAEIPQVFIVSVLTETSLEYYEKDNKDWKYTFTKAKE